MLALGRAVILFAAVALVVATASRAAEYRPAQLTAVASGIAGKHVEAACYQGASEWASVEYMNGVTQEADGFTFIGREPVVYLAPRVCDTLMALIRSGPNAVGVYWSALAIKTLLHEATHQYGVVDEGATDCIALGLVKKWAVSTFRFPATVRVPTYVRATKTTYRRVMKVVQNPQLAQLYTWALDWHRKMPIQYQGRC